MYFQRGSIESRDELTHILFDIHRCWNESSMKIFSMLEEEALRQSFKIRHIKRGISIKKINIPHENLKITIYEIMHNYFEM